MKKLLHSICLVLLVACGSGSPQPAEAYQTPQWVLVQQAYEGDLIELPDGSNLFFVAQRYVSQNTTIGDAGCQVIGYNPDGFDTLQPFPRFNDAQYMPYVAVSFSGKRIESRAKFVCVFDGQHVDAAHIDVYIEQ